MRQAADFEIFKQQVSQSCDPAKLRFVDKVQSNVPLYKGDLVRDLCKDASGEAELAAEWTGIFAEGPGIIVIKNALPDLQVIDRATEVFDAIIDREKAGAGGGGDHFAKPGANDRIWNSLQKHCLEDPENFVAYVGNVAVALACKAWLGDGYQMTAQVNRVNPGGAAQTPHRDYHLGFMPRERMAKFPRHVHQLSPALTLQGAIAHRDMPIEAGPTMYLPFSQLFEEGYVAFGESDYQAYFAGNYVQLPLEKGDAAFFNPALMHGAGNNVSTDIYRMGNLLQVSSAFGRAMENLDREAMCQATYPVLANSDLDRKSIECAVAAISEGYAFPTNLDSDPPIGGMAPKTQNELMHEALSGSWDAKKFGAALSAMSKRGKP